MTSRWPKSSEEEINTEFEISVVSNFLVPRSGPVRYQKVVKHFCRLYFRPLIPPSRSRSRGHFPRLQKSHRKKNERRRRGKTFFTFTKSWRSMQTKIKFRWLGTRKTSFNFHRKFYFNSCFNAEQNEAASKPRLSFVLHPCRQYFVPVDRSRIDVKI